MTVFHRNETREPLPQALRGGVIAIGNFDGVHRGHQSVLNRALEEARARGVPALVLTFEPHPRTVFRPDHPVFRLTPAPLKARILEGMGFSAVIEYPFDRTFSELSASDFIRSVLMDWLHAGHVVTGFDFHFGKGREGGPAFLMAAGGENGFGVTLVDAFRDENASVISSSHIRGLLGEGDVAEAAGMLGYRYTVESEVIGGKKLGRTLGYPTANMQLPPKSNCATASTPCASAAPTAVSMTALPVSASARRSTAMASPCSKPSSSTLPAISTAKSVPSPSSVTFATSSNSTASIRWWCR